MPLTEIKLESSWTELPDEISHFLAEADDRMDRFLTKTAYCFRGFVPSDFVALYHALNEIANRRLMAGNSFCEWGSGLGVVASMAGMLGWDAVGIEIDRDLVDAASSFAKDYEVPVEFVHGSFVPQGADRIIDQAYADFDGALSLDSHADNTYEELAMEVRDFDLIFAYPWPNDEALTADLFEHFAASGALLLTYDETDLARLRRKS